LELYQKYRPKTLKELVGQDVAVKSLSKMTKSSSVPHAIMLTGPSGCGKTTTALILKDLLECSDMDFQDMNCADFRGIESVRDIRQTVRLMPVSGKSRIWLIDEAHKLTNDAQNAFLKLLEFSPQHAYFMLATTDPNKLLPTIRTRCTAIQFKPLDEPSMVQLLKTVCAAEKAKISADVSDKIVEVAEGSPRKALVLLEQVLSLDDEKSRLACCVSSDTEKQAIDICRGIMSGASWSVIAKIIKEVKEEPETVRRMMLGYFNSVLLGGGKMAMKAAHAINSLRDNVFDSGRAGLTLAIWEAIHG
jgi:DNA polymerase III gamma/tau subunit